MKTTVIIKSSDKRDASYEWDHSAGSRKLWFLLFARRSSRTEKPLYVNLTTFRDLLDA